MKKVVVIPAYNRPGYLERTALSLALSPNPQTWHARIVHDDRPNHLGCSLNAFVAVQTSIQDGADAILYLEDDIEVSPDALELCDWYLSQPHGTKDVGIALCNRERNTPDDPIGIVEDSAQGLLGQGWCFTREQWTKFGRQYWWTYEPGMGKHDIWDWALGYMMQTRGMRLLRPRLSRSRHIGAIGFHGQSPVFPDVIATGTGHAYRLA